MALPRPEISCFKKDKALDKTSDESNTPPDNFQIGTPAGKKWNSKQHDLNGKVTLTSTDVEVPHFWIVEREVDEALWSFHVISTQGEKLYVSYDESSNDITLELRNDEESGKKRLFELLAQKEGGYLFRIQNSTNRYIRSNGEILEMFETDDPLESMQWLIVKDFDDVTNQSTNIYCEVKHFNKKWISEFTIVENPIPVRQKGSNILYNFQSWKVALLTGNNVKFSPFGRGNVFVTIHEALPDGIVLKKVTDPEIITYTLKASGGGYKLQTNMPNTQWVGLSDHVSDTILIRADSEILAPAWIFDTIYIPYQERNSTSVVFFPPLHSDTTE